MIDCSKCKGICCRHVINELDRGDGTCRFFDETTCLCSIYDHRPDICNTEIMYQKYYSKYMSWEEYSELNRKACEILRSNYLLDKESKENLNECSRINKGSDSKN